MERILYLILFSLFFSGSVWAQEKDSISMEEAYRQQVLANTLSVKDLTPELLADLISNQRNTITLKNEEILGAYKKDKKDVLEFDLKKRADVKTKSIIISLKDKKSGSILEYQYELNEKAAADASPKSLMEQFQAQQYEKMLKNSKAKNKTEAALRFVKNLPLEGLSFYAGIGAFSLLELSLHAEKDPKAFDNFLKSTTDPIGTVSLISFMMANAATNPALNSILYSSLFSKTSSVQKMRLSKVLLPQLSMAVGGIVSNITTDIAVLLQQCVIARNAPKAVELKQEFYTPEQRDATEVCDEAMKSIFSKDHAYEYLVSTAALISSGLAAGTVVHPALTKISKTLGVDKGVIRIKFKGINLQIPFHKAKQLVNWIPLPQVKAVTVLKSIGTHVFRTVINLGIFLGLDKWVFHPIFHGLVERHVTTGADLQTYHKEIWKRLQETNVSRGRFYQKAKATPTSETDKKKIENAMKEWFRVPIHDKLLNPDNYKEVKPKMQAVYGDSIFFGKKAEIGTESMLGGLISKEEEFSAKHLSFSELLDQYQTYTTKWRTFLMEDFETSYYSWLSVVSPFNAVSDMTYNFYDSFFDQVKNLKNKDDSENVSKIKHSEYFYGLNLTDDNGNIVSNNSVLNREQEELYQINTVKHNICLITYLEGTLNYVTQKGQSSIEEINQAIQSSKTGSLTQANKHISKNKRLREISKHISSVRKNLKSISYRASCNNQNVYTKVTKPMLISKNNFENMSLWQKVVRGINKIDNTLASAKPNKIEIRNALIHLNYVLHALSTIEVQKNLLFKDQVFALVKLLNDSLGDFTPYDRGERFLKEWHDQFIKKQPEYALQLANAPAHELLHKMACAENTGDNVIERSWMDELRGKVSFKPPRIVSKVDSNICEERRPDDMSNAGYAKNKLIYNQGMPQTIKYITQNTLEDIYKTNSDQQYFANWWNNTVEPQIDEVFNEFNSSYRKNIKNELVPLLTKNRSPMGAAPQSSLFGVYLPDENLTDAFLTPLELYTDLLGKVYKGLQKDSLKTRRWNELTNDFHGSFVQFMYSFAQEEAHNSNGEKINLSALAYGKVLARYKKIKSLFQNRGESTRKMITPNETDSSYIKAFKEDLLEYRKLLSGGKPESLRLEYLNLLEYRVQSQNDQEISDAFFEELEGNEAQNNIGIARKYVDITPVILQKNYQGDGIVAIKKILDNMMATLEEAYRISQLTNLVSDSVYKDIEIKEQLRRSGGSTNLN